MRRARSLDGVQPLEAADAVIDMDDEIAGGEARELGEDVAAALCPGAAHQPVAENVLLGDDGDVRRLEAVSPVPARRRQSPVAALPAPRRRSSTLNRVADAMLGQQRAPSARRPCSSRRPAPACPRFEPPGVGRPRHRRLCPLRSGAPRRRTAPACRRTTRRWRRARPADARTGRAPPFAALKGVPPVAIGEEQALDRHGLVGRRAEGFAPQRLLARLVMVRDLLEPLPAHPRRAGSKLTAPRADSRTASRDARRTAAANAPCPDACVPR